MAQAAILLVYKIRIWDKKGPHRTSSLLTWRAKYNHLSPTLWMRRTSIKTSEVFQEIISKRIILSIRIEFPILLSELILGKQGQPHPGISTLCRSLQLQPSRWRVLFSNGAFQQICHGHSWSEGRQQDLMICRLGLQQRPRKPDWVSIQQNLGVAVHGSPSIHPPFLFPSACFDIFEIFCDQWVDQFLSIVFLVSERLLQFLWPKSLLKRRVPC